MKKFNLFDYDDPVYPVFERKGAGQVLESANTEAVMESADSNVAGMAMSAVLSWVDGGDYSYSAFEEYAAGIADLDGDEDLSDSEQELFNDVLGLAADAFLSLGATEANVAEFLNDESDSAGEKLGAFISGSMDEESASDEDIIAGFVAGDSIMESGVLEASFKKMRVVRDGKVQVVKKRLGKVVLSAAQKAGLKKARRKAFTGAAKLARAKSMRIRKKRGL